VRHLRGVILYHLDVEKKINLDKSNLLECPFTKMIYHVRGCMTFRSNELYFLSKQGHIGHARGPWDGEERHGDFCFVP
jgi:hypothetical protein